MHIVHVAPELAQVAKAGGLGDVIYGLSKAQVKAGHQVDIILPKYDCIQLRNLQNLHNIQSALSFEVAKTEHSFSVWSAKHEELNLHLIEDHHPSHYYSRGCIYGEKDDIDRFFYFCKATLEYLFLAKIQPDIVHIHDWATALIAPLYQDIYKPKRLTIKGIVLSIHNLLHQGLCDPSLLSKIGLDKEKYLTPDRMQDPRHPHLINLLKGGIVYSNQINTVSPNYEKEIKTPEGGCGLHHVLLKNQDKLRGILNGIDINYWNPASDPLLEANYATSSPQDKISFEKILKGKKTNKTALQKMLSLEVCDKPIISSVTRLVEQKGPKLILDAIKRTVEKEGQFILLGSLASDEIIKPFLELKNNNAYQGQLAIVLSHNEQLAHLIYGGADYILVPSLFEPCGLTQMIAMRYGTVPIVRMTGGLIDTVLDIDTSEKPVILRNGFTFEFPDQEGLFWALDRGLTCYQDHLSRYHQLMKQGMEQDFSWKHAAPEYSAMYQDAMSTYVD